MAKSATGAQMSYWNKANIDKMQNRGDGGRKFPWTGDKVRQTNLAGEFHPSNRLMIQLGMSNYDQIDEIDTLPVNVSDNILALKQKWKVTKDEDLKRILRYQLTQELTKMEHRKTVRRD